MIDYKHVGKIGFSALASARIKQIIHRQSELQLSGLSPTERSEILRQILVTRHPDGSSLKVKIASQSATDLEFGTLTKPARPWIKKLQRNLASPVKAVLAQLLTPKK